MEKKDIFKQYLETNEVLIVDKNTNSRSRLLKTIFDLGAKKHMIHTCGHVQEAKEIIFSKKIGIVLSDYSVGGGSGFDLFKMVREKNPNTKEICFVLVTSNISQTAVAKAAEEDVDSFIIKPYTIQSIQENLISTVSSKIKPSVYMLKIEEGKSLISTKKYDEAIEVLNEARKLHSKPALALFYIGQAEYLKELSFKAMTSFNKGLEFNSIHYKCLVGLFGIYMKENRPVEAYQVVKKIAKYFPANPDRLGQIIRLAIQTENYDDMQSYYEIFMMLDERTSTTINLIGAGMFISGKHNLLKKNIPRAMQFFDNIAVSCSEFTKFIRAMISLLVEHDRALDAMKFLARFPTGVDMLEDFIVSDYLITAKTISDSNLLVKAGLDIYNRNIRDFLCMKILVDSMKKSGYAKDKMAPFVKEMNHLWPDRSSVSA